MRFPLHIVGFRGLPHAFLCPSFRQGLTRSELQSKFDWLYSLIKSRGGDVSGVETKRRDTVVQRGLTLLGALVTEQRKDFFLPTIFQRSRCEFP